MQALLALALGTALTGIDVGWQPIEEGGLEYIVQIEPETLARLKPGDELATGIRPVLRDVRRYRIVIGKGPLPRIALPEGTAPAPSRSSQPQVAPVPLAASEPEQSIVVPAERPAPAAIPAAPLAPGPAPPARIATVPQRPASAPPAPRAQPAVGEWQAPGAAKSADTAPQTVPVPRTAEAPATLKLEEAQVTPPQPLNLKTDEAKRAPVAAFPPAPAKEIMESPPPAPNLGDRYRNVQPAPAADNHPPSKSNPAPERKPASPIPTGDRYRDLLAPPPIQPKAPTEAKDNRSAEVKIPAANQIVEKPNTSTQELVGPVLPPASTAGPAKERPRLSGPSFDFSDAEATLRPVAKTAPSVAPAARNPPAEKTSRLLAENFGEKPATLVSDPAVQPASVEPTPKAKAPLPAAATAPASTSSEAPPPPWIPFTITLFILFASLGGNVFLGWIAHDARARHGSLLRERRQAGSAAVPT